MRHQIVEPQHLLQRPLAHIGFSDAGDISPAFQINVHEFVGKTGRP